MGIAFYMRFILHDGTVWATDEGNYLEIITKLQNGRTFPLSGPLYVWVVEQFQCLLDASLIQSLPFYALISASVLPALFFIFYYQIVTHESFSSGLSLGDNASFAFICVLMLLSSSYFIWPMIEGRPQQLGFLLMVVVLYLYYQQLLNASLFQFVALILLSTVLFYYHILSFIFFISVASMLWFWFYINKQCSLLSILLPVLVISISLFVFTETGGVYHRMYINLLTVHLKVIALQQAGTGIGLLILTAFLLQKPILYLVNLVRTALYRKYFIFLLILISFAALMIQLYLLGTEVLYFYRESIIVFIVFQSGNLFFLVCYFFGLYYLNLQNKLNQFFVIGSFLFLILAGFSLLISFYLGDKTLLIRLLTFWVLLATPVASVAFIKFYQFNRGFLVVLSSAIILSIILSSKSGYFFNFEFFWDSDDIEAVNWACHNHGDYKINHTESKLMYFSKEENYERLKNILCPKKELSFAPIQQACTDPVYQKGYVQICPY
jgi:hypothetical protein